MLHCSVAEARERISSAEFAYWKAEYRRRPWGGEVTDLFQSKKSNHMLPGEYAAAQARKFKVQ